MAPKLKRSTKGTPEPAPRGGDTLRRTPQRVTYQIPRADIFAASQADLAALLEEMVSTTPALTEEEEPLVGEVLPEDAPEDEDAPELLGEMGEDYGDDPDGDFSEPQTDANDFAPP